MNGTGSAASLNSNGRVLADETVRPFGWDNIGAGNNPASIASNTVLGSLALSDWEGRPCVQDLHPTLSIASDESTDIAPAKPGALTAFAQICEDYGIQEAASSEGDTPKCRVVQPEIPNPHLQHSQAATLPLDSTQPQIGRASCRERV